MLNGASPLEVREMNVRVAFSRHVGRQLLETRELLASLGHISEGLG
jgi:hypothetical protein